MSKPLHIKRCPFCGGKAGAFTGMTEDGGYSYTVICKECGVGIFRARTTEHDWSAYASEYEAIRAWNRRHTENG